MKVIVAKDGFNALTETDPDNLKFSSDYNTLKYYLEGNDSFTIPTPAGSGDHTILTHNLGYTPFFACFVDDTNFTPTQYYSLPYSFADAGAYLHFFVYVNSTILVFRYNHSGLLNPISLTFYYKIFKNAIGT